jgi:hypothetical protein
MNRYKVLLRSPRFFVIVVVIAGAIYLGGNAWSSNKFQKSIIKINNHTQTFQVINAEKHDGHIKLLFRNDSQKSITAFVISSTMGLGGVFSVKKELIYSAFDDSFITAGSVYEETFGIPGSLYNQKNITLDLMAVVFDDKSNEGDPQVVQGIEDERLAEKTQFARAIPLFDTMLGLSNSDMQSYLKANFKHDLLTALDIVKKDLRVQLKKESPQLMIQKETEESLEPVDNGLRSGREYLLEMIKDLENIQKPQGEETLREEIIRTRQILEKILNRL